MFERLEAQVARWQRTGGELQRTNAELLDRGARWSEHQRLARRLDDPLSAIAQAAEGLRSRTDPDERADLLGVIEEQALRARALAAELRDRSVRERTDLVELDLATWLATEIPALRSSGFEVVEGGRDAATSVLATADPDRLSQALLEAVRVAHQAAGGAGRSASC